MQAAILSGLYGVERNLPVSHCSSGNCAWPEYYSLGIHGECANVSNEVRPRCTRSTCSYTTPAGFHLDRIIGDTPTVLNISTRAVGIDPVHFGVLSQAWNNATHLFDCYLAWTGIHVDPREFKNGTLAKASSKSHSLKWPVPQDVPQNMTQDLSATGSADLGNRTFTVSSNAWRVTQRYLTEILNLSLRLADRGEHSTGHFPNDSVPLQDYLGFMLWRTNNETNMRKVVRNLSSEMTKQVQHAVQLNKSRQEVPGGVAYIEVQRIGFQWQWLMLPICVVSIATVLLAAVAIISRKKGVRLYKSSLLPIAFGAFDHRRETSLPWPPDTRRALTMRARATRRQL